jgi:hypothetical protein
MIKNGASRLYVLPGKEMIRDLAEGRCMMLTEIKQERRKYERYAVEGPAYAAIGPDFGRMGHIVNISRSGLAFTYIKHRDRSIIEVETMIQISDNQETVGDFPFISISDKGGDLADPFSSVEVRYHRGRFGRLSREQKQILLAFLEMKTAFETEQA